MKQSTPELALTYVISWTVFRHAETENTLPKVERVLPLRLPAMWSLTLTRHTAPWMLWFPLLTAIIKILPQYHSNVLRHQCLQLSALLLCQDFITQRQEWQTQTSTCISATLLQHLIYYILGGKREHSSVNLMNSWGTGIHEWKAE